MLVSSIILCFSPNENSRKPIPKVVMYLYKPPQLKAEMRKYGLSTVGDRKTLELRLQNFITLYNAECDSPKPMSITECRNQVEDEEKRKNNFCNKVSQQPLPVF